MNRSLKVLVLSACTQTKSPEVPTSFSSCAELEVTKWRKWRKQQENVDKVLISSEMYLGRGFQTIINAIQKLRNIASVDHFIVSAGLGLVNELEYIPKYECTFNTMTKIERKNRFQKLKVNDILPKLLDKQQYDIIFILLGKLYLEGIYSSFPEFNKYITMLLSKDEKLIQYQSVFQIPTDVSIIAQLKEFGLPVEMVTNLKGHMFSLFINVWLSNSAFVEDIILSQNKGALKTFFDPKFLSKKIAKSPDKSKSKNLESFF